MEILIAELEQEAADDTALDETFDLDYDETREILIAQEDLDPTRPYEISPLQLVSWAE